MDDDGVSPFVESIISSSTAPAVVIRHLANLLITKTISEDGHSPARRLLSLIQQRYPTVIQEVADEISRSRIDLQESIDTTMISLSTATAPQAADPNTDVGSLVASMSADERVRAAAVKELIKALASQDQDPLELVRQLSMKGLFTLTS